MELDNITCPECGHTIGHSKISKPQPILDTCSVCGGHKTFHLCPRCDQKKITVRQQRLEKGIVQARQNQENYKGALEAQIRVRDYLAETELVKNGHEKRYLARTVLYGFIIALPLIALGLQMSIQSVMVPLGFFILLAGFISLAIAVHFRLLYDKTKDAKRWLWLSKSEKYHELSSVTFQQRPVAMSQSPQISHFTKVR